MTRRVIHSYPAEQFETTLGAAIVPQRTVHLRALRRLTYRDGVWVPGETFYADTKYAAETIASGATENA